VYPEQVVESRRGAVADVRLGHERLDPAVAERLVPARVATEVLDARELEPDEVGGVVGDRLRIRLGEPHAYLDRVGERVHGRSIDAWPPPVSRS
jgi:hypothetical protein